MSVRKSDAECKLLAFMMLGQEHITNAVKLGITAKCYGSPKYACLHESVIDAAIDTNGHADAVAVANQLWRTGRMESVCGAAFLARVLSSVSRNDDFSLIAATVLQK